MRRVHLAVGLLGFVVFVSTGAYMRTMSPGIEEVDTQVRLLLRSRHVYLLFTALLNGVMGAYYRPAPPGWRTAVQRIGSGLLLAAVPMMLVAFAVEPWGPLEALQIGPPVVIGSAVGVACQLVARGWRG